MRQFISIQLGSISYNMTTRLVSIVSKCIVSFLIARVSLCGEYVDPCNNLVAVCLINAQLYKFLILVLVINISSGRLAGVQPEY